MAFGRWYPTVTELPDGRMLTMAGRDSAGNVVTTPEIWENNQWVKLPGAGALQIPYYPRNFIDPKNGLDLHGRRADHVALVRPGRARAAGGRGRWITGPSHIWPFNRDYGTAVMYEPGKILVVGGGGNTGWTRRPTRRSSAPTATAEKIDLNAGSPTWQQRRLDVGSRGGTSTPRSCRTARCSSPAAPAGAASWTSTRGRGAERRSSGTRAPTSGPRWPPTA